MIIIIKITEKYFSKHLSNSHLQLSYTLILLTLKNEQFSKEVLTFFHFLVIKNINYIANINMVPKIYNLLLDSFIFFNHLRLLIQAIHSYPNQTISNLTINIFSLCSFRAKLNKLINSINCN